MGKALVLTELRALRRAVEGGAQVERLLVREGQPLPAPLRSLVRHYDWKVQWVPASALPSGTYWAALLSPLRLYTLEEWLQSPPRGIALGLLGITDPRNVGAICRSALAFGVKWIMLKAEGSPLTSNPALWRASAGALAQLYVVREKRPLQALQRLHAAGWEIVATTPRAEGAMPYFQWNWATPSIILLGEEQKGIPAPYLRLASVWLTVPHHPSVESLNVSAVAAILLAEAFRQNNL
ncbi:MAG: RNA methyltransferase [Bacteroidia bacterium]